MAHHVDSLQHLDGMYLSGSANVVWRVEERVVMFAGRSRKFGPRHKREMLPARHKHNEQLLL